MSRQHNNIGDLLKSSSSSISEDDLNFQLQLNEFPHDFDSTILVRERAGSKLQRASRRQLGPLFSESKHTLSLLPTRKATPRLFSKHDVAHAHQQTDEQTPPREQNTRREVTNRNDATVIDEQTSCVQEQIAEPQTVGRNDKVCKRP